jgi:hypothetical protein
MPFTCSGTSFQGKGPDEKDRLLIMLKCGFHEQAV